MAASDSQLAAGRSLAGDLRAIRRKHSVDLKEVLDATRLADDVIEQLEEDALVNHPAFNRVYLRSLFGAYGDAVGIKKEDMVAALEQVFDGNYVGSLARQYLGHVVDESDMDAILTARTSVDEDPELEEIGTTTSDDTETDGDAEDDHEPEEEGAAPFVSTLSDGFESESGTNEGEEGEVSTAQHEDDSSDSATSEDEDDEGADEDSEDTDEEGRRTVRTMPPSQASGANVWAGLADRKTVLLPNMSGTALVVIAGIAFVALLWFAISTIMNLTPDEEVEAVVQDSSAVEEVFRPERVLLPDSMEVSVIAFTERLDPIRITADRDLRKPYWVELLDTHRVVVTERILLEREADHTRVLVDGFAVPEDWLLEEDPVDISRNRVQTWLDSLVSEGIAPQREVLTRPSGTESP